MRPTQDARLMSEKSILLQDQAQRHVRQLLGSALVQLLVHTSHIRTLEFRAEGTEAAAAVVVEDAAVVGIGAAADTEAAVGIPPTYRYDSAAELAAGGIRLGPEPEHPALVPATVQEAATAAQPGP